MSRDNGMYILQSPKQGEDPITGRKEYRIAHTTNIENIELDDRELIGDMQRAIICEAAIFGDCQVHEDANAAIAEACMRVEMFKQVDEDGGGYIEYGIVVVPRPHPFPRIPAGQALRLLGWCKASRYN
ncbi:hypothetical protein [Geomonas subterranea]|uniref:hypothetical protein n=1 Tax=Geomonas subterranea TaxID=2847989 RepID=UPI001CD39045|nr:hypothetical protein [Geomonas fuzhouensis]